MDAAARCHAPQQRVAGLVDGLREPAGQEQEQEQQPNAGGEERGLLDVVLQKVRNAQDVDRAEHGAGKRRESADHRHGEQRQRGER